MELIPISENKLKIMLTADDMENYSISNEEMTYERADTRKVFSAILEEAEQRCGFKASKERLVIQVYPIKHGGCEVFVTSTPDIVQSERTEKRPQGAGIQKKRKEHCVYEFDSFSEVERACIGLVSCGYSYTSELYYEETGDSRTRYFLVLQEDVPSTQSKRRRSVSKSDVAGEFGKRLEKKVLHIQLRERAGKIFEKSAIEKVCGLTSKKG